MDRIVVTNPATDAVVGSVANSGAAEARAAVDRADTAWPSWRDLTAADRAERLHQWAALLRSEEEALAKLMTAEQGKPLGEARGEVRYAADFVAWSAEEGRRISGETLPASATDKRILILRQPAGVAAAVTPWNFPVAIPTRKAAAALAAGCPIVIKPAEQTPLTAVRAVELAHQAGISPDVIAVLTGDPEAIVGAWLGDRRVRRLSFTGSTDVGRLLIRGSAENVTGLTLELGGHAPLIVFDDADLDAAAQGAVAAKFRNAGQTCICANRIWVHESVHDDFLKRFAAAVIELRVGPGGSDGIQVGPLIDDAAIAKVTAHVDDALHRGAQLLTGGKLVDIPGCASRFYAPTILTGIHDDMLITREETFGPVAPVSTFRDEDDVIEHVNGHRYGLAAYFYTRDASRLLRVAERLQYGIVGANDALPSTAQAPIGGVRDSGLGREGGRWGVEDFLDVKFVSWQLSN